MKLLRAVTAGVAFGLCAVPFSSAFGQGVPTPTPCTELPYPPPTPDVSLSVSPTPPVVGDQVTLLFHVLTYPNGPPGDVVLSGATPIFEIDGSQVTSYFYGADIQYRVTATQLGIARLVLSFESEIAYGCAEHPIYSFRGFQSGPFAVEVVGPITPTPTPTVTPSPSACVGDCDGSGKVTIDELVEDVNIALGVATRSCPAFDCNGKGSATVDCLVEAVNNALNGCPAPSCPTGTHRVCHGGSGRGGGYHSTCSCVANPPPVCVTSYGSQVASSGPITLYDALTATYPDTCVAHGFVTTCDNGAFNPVPPPSYGYIVCNVVYPNGGE